MKTLGAEFSKCEQYRYRLWRSWGPGEQLVFIMLNPSTADDVVNDSTIDRCERRAKDMGFGSLMVVNIFALRSPYPKDLYTHKDPVGPENDRHIRKTVAAAGMVICGWGAHGKLNNRGRQVMDMILAIGVTPYYLKLNKDGSPGHPLYIGYDVKPKSF